MIIIIHKFQVHQKIVILTHLIFTEINHNIHLVLVKAIIILHKIILSMLKITHWLMNPKLDTI